MIEFCGELSSDCKLYLLKDITRFSYFAALLVIIVLSIPIVLIGIFWNIWICLFLVVPILFGILLAHPRTNPQIKTIELNVPTKITISKTIIEREGNGERNYASKKIVNIKEIIDTGEWYHIIFYLGYKDIFFICQKNLITKGTIEEFEKLFEGKIVRKKL